jgi:hypothetical protein
MMMGWPRFSPSLGENPRASTSDGPPAANGMISLIGWLGYPCALASDGRAIPKASKVKMIFLMYRSPRYYFFKIKTILSKLIKQK